MIKAGDEQPKFKGNDAQSEAEDLLVLFSDALYMSANVTTQPSAASLAQPLQAKCDSGKVMMSDLPVEILFHIFIGLSGSYLARVCSTSSLWRQLAPTAAEHLVRAREPLLPKEAACHAWARSLTALEELEEHIGPAPSRTWQDEWVRMRMEQARLLAISTRNIEAFERHCDAMHDQIVEAFEVGGQLTIEVEAKQSCSRMIAWKEHRGWGPRAACAGTLLISCGSAALACSLMERSPRYAASLYELHRILDERAWLGDVAPETFASLHGPFGAATEDASWSVLSADPSPGLTWRSKGVVLAMVANQSSFPDGNGFRCPVNERGEVRYELRDSDIVRFISSAPDRSGSHSLVETDLNVFRLPPLALVRLERTENCGEWRANGHLVQRRCYTVSVSY
mmetsp:Transcript_35013/g.57941  ORF Transcript_35013/g.57941 Transcript_35013/m.57941 type:complete len:396 (-) Transcript_35013:172-1359(-)